MAQEDKGLILRGLLLFAAIGVLAAFVLGVLLWKQPAAEVEPVPVGEMTPSEPGWQVRYNAAASLARRGSDAVPWDLIREMLDEKTQRGNYLERTDDGKAFSDDAAARANIITALRALTTWHEKQNAAGKTNVPPELREIYAQVERLTASPFVELQVQATKARSHFFAK